MKANKKKHLSFEERFCIKKMLGAGKSFGEISRYVKTGEPMDKAGAFAI